MEVLFDVLASFTGKSIKLEDYTEKKDDKVVLKNVDGLKTLLNQAQSEKIELKVKEKELELKRELDLCGINY